MPADLLPLYLDHAATTPVDPRVVDAMMRYMAIDIGNAGSRTHAYGMQAAKAVKKARELVASVVNAEATEVIFTSGATEAINLAILGLSHHGITTGKRHIISSTIEHKATLETLQEMERRGFDVTLIQSNQNGWIEPDDVLAAVRDDTMLVSVMHVNNETGVIQPLERLATGLADHEALFHTDAAQGFGKDLSLLINRRIDMISISGHKIGGPMGIGALILRRRRYKLPPIQPLMFGGGQERGLRAGTLPVPLIVGIGEAARLAYEEHESRQAAAMAFRHVLIDALSSLPMAINGDADRSVPGIINLSFGEIDSEAIMLSLKGLVAISNGSACTSSTYASSHVLSAMCLPASRIQGATRWSWSHATPHPDWPSVASAIQNLL